MPRHLAYVLSVWFATGLTGAAVAADNGSSDNRGAELFEKKIRPVLVDRCYSCHSRQTKSPKGELFLDTREGLRRGGESGPVIVPGKPDESPLIQALRYESVEMPPQGQLPEAVIADFVKWVELGAPDPRSQEPAVVVGDDWESRFQERRKWWSAQPVVRPALPQVERQAWCRNEIDRFVLARQEAKGLQPAPEADRRTLARRLTFALTGLPPQEVEIYRFVADRSPQAYERLVDRLLASPHFGERWARHWMDVVHYADTHGYEWDHPAKGAWVYRDYLVRAFNRDVPYRQLILEQLAGDLLSEPRIDREANLNESMIGLVSLRLGERRHGDSAEFEGIHQEAIDNVIDTVSKAYQATTVACSRCHDHKLDAVAQSDYYALAGVLMSSRWVSRVVDAEDPNEATIAAMRKVKDELRPVLAELWLRDLDGITPALMQCGVVDPKKSESKDAKEVPAGVTLQQAIAKLLEPKQLADDHPLHPWKTLIDATDKGEAVAVVWNRLAEHYGKLADQRAAANRKNLRLVADFTTGKLPVEWNAEGFGLEHGFVRDGELIVAEAGTAAVRQLLPAGLYTHVYSTRLAGALRSPLSTADRPWLSFAVVGGDLAARHVVVDNAMFPESRHEYLALPELAWHTVSTLAKELAKGRRTYVELNTKSLNNYFPPRVGLGGYKGADRDGPHSWFGVTKVYAHGDQASVPQDELQRFTRLFAGEPPQTLEDAAVKFQAWFRTPVEHWRDQQVDAEDVALVEWLLANDVLMNRADATPKVTALIAEYRRLEAKIQCERTVGGVADLAEGRDERMAIRGSYTELGAAVPRGYIRLLCDDRAKGSSTTSGRLELAQAIADPQNPLTSRVFVNRVWSYLFGQGLVTTVDDFGHLGEKPSDPELLDHLAARFLDDGWSSKSLIRSIVTSATWRQSGDANPAALAADPDNRLWHHYPLRRLEAEAIRDAMLAVSGRLDPRLYGPPVEPHRSRADPAKRLFIGPVDGDGRRSLYVKMTLMEPPKFLTLFNQPLPKLTVGHRDVTNVPDQALALLNDPFVVSQAQRWAAQVVQDPSNTVAERVESMFLRSLGRPPESDERERFIAFVARMAKLRAVPPAYVLQTPAVWQDVAHALFNLKEFIYVR